LAPPTIGPILPDGPSHRQKGCTNNLGAFPVSLAVKDLAASRGFDARLGFHPVAGQASENLLILRSGKTEETT